MTSPDRDAPGPRADDRPSAHDAVDPDAVDPGVLERELANVGPGPDPLSLAAHGADRDFLYVLLQRDHYCPNCRDQVRDVADRFDAFRARGTGVVSVLPEPRERAAEWQSDYDLPFPLLADPAAAVGGDFDQPVRFGLLGRFSDFLGRMPVAVLLDLRGPPRVAWRHAGSSTFDRPSVDDLLARVDEHRAADEGPSPAAGRRERR